MFGWVKGGTGPAKLEEGRGDGGPNAVSTGDESPKKKKGGSNERGGENRTDATGVIPYSGGGGGEN